ncbi:MAG: hypothetical protein AAFU77_02215 [Myxococcota bacterium]
MSRSGYQRRSDELAEMITQSYVDGVSQRDVGNLLLRRALQFNDVLHGECSLASARTEDLEC